MADWTGQFGFVLRAVTQIDRPALQRADATISKTFARSGSVGVALDQKSVKKLYDDAGRSIWSSFPRIPPSTVKETAKGALSAGSFAKRIRDVKDQLKAGWHMGGLGRALEDFRHGHDALRRFREEGEGIAKLFGPAGTLLELGSVAGLGAMVANFGAWAQNLRNNAGNIGVSTGTLQGWQGLASIQGLGAGTGTTALGDLQQNLFAASRGLPEGAQALGAARYFGLNVNKGPTSFLKDLAGKMQGQLPMVQYRMARAFGVEELLPVLRQGVPAIERYLDEVQRATTLSRAQIEAGDRLAVSFNLATMSTEGMAHALGAQLAPTLVPLLNDWKNWMEELKTSPGKMKLVTTAAEVLAAVLGVTLVSGIFRLGAAMTAWWALPAVRFLISPAGAALLAAFSSIELLTSNGVSGLVPTYNPSGALPPGLTESERHQDPLYRAGQAVSHWWHNLWGGGNAASKLKTGGLINSSNEAFLRGVISQAGGNEMAQAGLLSNFQYESSGLKPGAVNPTSGATGFAQWLGPRLQRLRSFGSPTDRETQGKLLYEELTGKYKGVLDAMNKAPSPTAAAKIGLEGYEGVNRLNSLQAGAPWDKMVATHTAYADRFYRRAVAAATAAVASPAAPTAPGAAANATAPTVPFVPSAQYLASAAALKAHPGAWSAIPPWIKHNSRGQAYDVKMSAGEFANQAASYAYLKSHPGHAFDVEGGMPADKGQDYEPAAAQDSEHSLNVQFDNAPAGMRTGLSKIRGPGNMSVRTHVAFALP